MSDLKFVPLALDAERAANLIPEGYIPKFYERGQNELEAALLVNVMGERLESLKPVGNKWFNSEMYLSSVLDAIRDRDNTLPELSDSFKEALSRVEKSTKTPSWLVNSRSRELQMYALMVWDAMKRFHARYERSDYFTNSGQLLSSLRPIPFYDWINYVFCPNYTNGILNENSIRKLNGTLYQQSLRAFYRRSPLIRVFPRFQIRDNMSRLVRDAQTLPKARFDEARSNRLRKLGIGPLGTEYIPEAQRDDTLTEWVNRVTGRQPNAQTWTGRWEFRRSNRDGEVVEERSGENIVRDFAQVYQQAIRPEPRVAEHREAERLRDRQAEDRMHTFTEAAFLLNRELGDRGLTLSDLLSQTDEELAS